MDKNKLTAKEIFLSAGNSVLAGGVAALSTTHLPAVLPSVFVGAFCFQTLQQLWEKRKIQKNIDSREILKQEDTLRESLGELGFREERHFDQICLSIRWMAKALENLGDRVVSLEKGYSEQSDTIDCILNITQNHEKAIREISEKLSEMKAPKQIRDILSLASGIYPGIDRKELYKALVECGEGILEKVIGLLQVPGGILSGRHAPQSERVNDLVSWAESLHGPGLGKVYLCYKEALNPQ